MEEPIHDQENLLELKKNPSYTWNLTVTGIVWTNKS